LYGFAKILDKEVCESYNQEVVKYVINEIGDVGIAIK